MKLRGVVVGVFLALCIGLIGRYTYRLIWAPNITLEASKVDVYIGTDPDFETVLSAVAPYLTRLSDFELMARIKRLDEFPLGSTDEIKTNTQLLYAGNESRRTENI